MCAAFYSLVYMCCAHRLMDLQYENNLILYKEKKKDMVINLIHFKKIKKIRMPNSFIQFNAAYAAAKVLF